MADAPANSSVRSAREPEGRPDPTYDDEISLIDLWRVLERRVWWIVGIGVVVLLAGAAYGFLQVPQYAQQTAIELGQDDEGQPIQEADVAISILNEVLIPDAARDLVKQGDAVERPPRTHAHSLEGTNIAQLTTTAPLAAQEAVREFHRLVIRRLEQEHAEETERLRTRLGDERRASELAYRERVGELQAELESVDDRKARLGERVELLEQEKDLVKQQIEALEPLMMQLQAAIKGTDSESASLWTLTPRTSVVEMRHNAERRLHTEIPAHMQDLNQVIQELARQSTQLEADIERARERHELELATLDRRIDRVRQTAVRGSVYAVASDTPEGPGRSLIVALSLVLGLMLGVFGAFFREFLASVRATETE